MKLQSAIEFITTYGWAFAVVALVLLALFVSGYFNTANYAAQECVLTSSFSCLSFFMVTNGVLTVNLQQSLTEPINITAIGCNTNTSIRNMKIPYNPPTNQIYLPIGANYTFNVQCYTLSGVVSGSAGSAFTGSLIVNYTNDLTKLPGEAVGHVIVKFT